MTPLPRAEDDESAILIQEKGYAHEADYLAALEAKRLRVAEIRSDGEPAELAQETRVAMQAGHDVIFQATFLSGVLYGRADFLRRVERPSRLGDYSYEVLDTKLARSAKAKFVVQLAFYSDLLADVQGVEPQMMHLVFGDATERSFRVAELLALFPAGARSLSRFRRTPPERHVSATVPALRVLHMARRLRRPLESGRSPQPGGGHHAQSDRAAADSGYGDARGARRTADRRARHQAPG